MRRGTGLAGKLLELAKQHGGRFVTTEEAIAAVFPNGQGTEAARRKIYQAVYKLKEEGRLRGGHSVFAWPVVIAPKLSEDDELAAVTPRSMGRSALAQTLNKFARLRNAYDQAFDDLLTEARHAIRVSEPAHGDREAMRRMEPWEREP
jgi:hypothetical protein